jgi:hypothetical protein
MMNKTGPHQTTLNKAKVFHHVLHSRLLTSGHTHIGIGLHCMTLLDARDDDARVLLPAAANFDFGSGLSVELLLDASGYS